jgi:hypothetical protein
MLVNCPRCGFEQPKDKYCAQCGVDTESFKPPRKSAFKTYLTNPALYVGIAILVAVIFFKTTYKPTTSSLTQRVQFLKGNVQIANRTAGKTVDANSAARDIASTETAPPAAAAAAPPEPPAPTANAAATAPAPKTAAASDEPVVIVTYAEVPSHAMEKIRDESESTGQFNTFGDYSAGVLPDVEKRLHAEPMKIQVLETTQKTIGMNERLFDGIHDAEFDEDLGLTTFVELSSFENDIAHGRVEVVRSWRDAADAGVPGALQKMPYPAAFDLNPGAGLFIAGILPRKSRVAHFAELTGKKPFQILNSVSFQNKESEFVIFIEFRKKP